MLFDALTRAGISKKEACELFDKSPKTLKRWNEFPPQWAINIINMIGNYKVLPLEWQGWYFDNQWIIDPNGNSYHVNDVANLWIERQITQSVRGDCLTIHSLKTELEKKLDAIDSEIFISVSFGNVKKDFQIAI